MFQALNTSSAGLGAQRRRMNAIADNIANAETTRTEEGGPYRRKEVIMQAGKTQKFVTGHRSAEVTLSRTSGDHMSGGMIPFSEGSTTQEAITTVERTDPSDFKIVHNPGHPDADENGYVKMPNVSIVTEMVDMIAASRAFEANVTAINATKAMAKDSLEI